MAARLRANVASDATLSWWVVVARLAGVAGWVWRTCTSSGRPALIGLPIVLVVAYVTGSWVWVAAYALLLLLVAGWNVQRRIVVDEITDNTADGELSRGAAALLAVELGRLGEVYRATTGPRSRGADGPRRADGPPGSPAPAAPARSELDILTTGIEFTTDLEDFASALRGAVSAESTITVGPIGVPVGAVLAIVGRLVQAPRISASLRAEEGRVLISARLTGGGRRGTWQTARVIGGENGEGDRAEGVRALIHELACQIFTDVGLRGSTSWRTAEHLASAIQHYRESQRGRSVSRLSLVHAQQELLLAIEHDEEMFEAYFNLGVVNRELGRADYAAGAFRRAAEIGPSRWEAPYALAQMELLAPADRGRFTIAQRHQIDGYCRHVLALERPTAAAAAAHSTMGLVWGQPTSDPAAWQRSIEHRRAAARLGLRALAVAELGSRRSDADGGEVPAARAQAAELLRSLGEGYAGLAAAGARGDRPPVEDAPRRRVTFHQISRPLRLAVRLDPGAVGHRVAYGRLASQAGKAKLAERLLSEASDASPTSTEIWLALARVHADRAGVTNAGEEAEGTPPGDAVQLGLEALERGIALWDLTARATIPEVARDDADAALRALRTSDPERIDQLLAMLSFANPGPQLEPPALEAAGRFREAAAVWTTTPMQVKVTPRPDGMAAISADVDGPYLRALQNCKRSDYPSDVRRWALHGRRAFELLGRGIDSGAPVREAQLGVSADPLSALAYWYLGYMYVQLEDWSQGRDAYRAALSLDPDEATYHAYLGNCLHRLLYDAPVAERRRAVAEAARYFENAVALWQSLDLSVYGDDAGNALLAWARYRLGLLYTDANLPERAIPHLRVLKRTWAAPLAALQLGRAYQLSGDLSLARTELESIIERGEGLEPYVGGSVNEAWPRDLLIGYAHQQLAAVLVRAGPDADGVRDHLGLAQQRIASVPDPRTNQVLAGCESVRAQLHLWSGDVDDAVTELTRATAHDPQAGYYVRLATAYERKLADSTPVERVTVLANARDAQVRALRIDSTGRYRAQLEELGRRLEAAAVQPPAGGSAAGQPPAGGSAAGQPPAGGSAAG